MTRLTFKKDGRLLRTRIFTVVNGTVSAILDTDHLVAEISFMSENNVNTFHLGGKSLNGLKRSVKTTLQAHGVNFEDEVRVRLPNAESK